MGFTNELLQKFFTDIDTLAIPDEAKDDLKQQLKDRIKVDNCPMYKGKPVNPMRCFTCAFGHLLHCHFPYICSDPLSKCTKARDDSEDLCSMCSINPPEINGYCKPCLEYIEAEKQRK